MRASFLPIPPLFVEMGLHCKIKIQLSSSCFSNVLVGNSLKNKKSPDNMKEGFMRMEKGIDQNDSRRISFSGEAGDVV